ncbi:hypothetical protein OQ257_11505 [Actinobacillus equuli subsp. equuli]|uniref:Uncharacterized protein n=1 Tax=Actinobacillus equuli subsp. equuli TaxID=202947 RepID=A0A9X4G667_ACTEU|nr:hypothetical protein [Actinobacillus equuli]MDE8035777.1 hypothetical protein [Actinobacillus equuli subsp. equuli]
MQKFNQIRPLVKNQVADSYTQNLAEVIMWKYAFIGLLIVGGYSLDLDKDCDGRTCSVEIQLLKN